MHIKLLAMYIVRDIFQLQFGHYRDAKALLQSAKDQKLLPPDAKEVRILSDFTGDAYRLIFEQGYDSLSDYEKSMEAGMGGDEWKNWYENFKKHVISSHREILKLVF